MTKSNALCAALTSAVLLTMPVEAGQGKFTSPRLVANVRNSAAYHGAHRQACCRNRSGDLRNPAGRDVWGHWGAYYGPMVLTF
jgi:hypothetical protein